MQSEGILAIKTGTLATFWAAGRYQYR